MSDLGFLPDHQQTLLKIKMDGHIEAAVQAAQSRKIGLQEALSLTIAAVLREMAAHSFSREASNRIWVAALNLIYREVEEPGSRTVN